MDRSEKPLRTSHEDDQGLDDDQDKKGKMIRIDHNADQLAEAIAGLKQSVILRLQRRAMLKALTSGRVVSTKELRKVIRAPKDTTFAKHFKKHTGMRLKPVQGQQVEGYLRFSSKTRGLKNYTTRGRLERHREQANQHFAQSRSNRPTYAKPLVFDIIPGKKTKLKRTFVGKGAGKSGLQVFRRPKDGGRLKRPKGPSLANQMRSGRNQNITKLVQRRMRQVYLDDYARGIRIKFDRAVKRANQRALRAR